MLPSERSSPATTSATAPISRKAITLGVSWRSFSTFARWSSGCDAANNAVTARRASTSAGRTSGRNTLLARLGPTVPLALHATGPGSGGGGEGGGGGGGGGGSATPGGADVAAGGGERAPIGSVGGPPSSDARDADRR